MMLNVAGDSRHAHVCAAAYPHVKRQSSPFSLKSFRASLLATAAICAVMVLTRPASAQSPTGGNVVAGAAGISQAGAVTNIDQSSQKAIINWQGFSVGAQNTVNFNQPNSSAATLNRVIGNEQSVINGAINANGQVFIVNSNGVLFGKGAQVNVGGLVASTPDISNNDFMAGNYKFSGSSNASVVNQGRIRAHGDGQGGGYVALLGKTVSNEGVIAAKLGTVAMAAGEQITLNFGGDSLVDVTIDKGTLNALVQNKRAIIANGGQVIMTAKAADQVLSAQVNNSGIIQARTMAALKGGSSGSSSSGSRVKIGKIKLLAQGGTTKVSGKLDASAPKGGDGGFIETSGDHVQIADSAVITTKAASGNSGTWLIDPTDFNIVAGNGASTDSGIGATTLLNLLTLNGTATFQTVAGGSDLGDININAALTLPANSNLTLTAANNINVNAAVNWSSGTLTLNAGANIYVNAAMAGTSTATFVGNYGAGTNADGTPMGLYTAQNSTTGAFNGILKFTNLAPDAFKLNGVSYTVITTAAGLAGVRSDLAGAYVVGDTISGIATAGFTAIGSSTTPFIGQFNGLGHVISAVPKRPTDTTLIATGIFGEVGSGAIISNLGVKLTVNAGATSQPAVGLLANVNHGSIINSFAVGTLNTRVTGSTVTVDSAGGLVGVNSGLIAQSYSQANVLITTVGGGLVGTNEVGGVIIDSSAFATSATDQVANQDSSTRNITYAGGFVGLNNGTIRRSYAANVVKVADSNLISSDYGVGGFVGKNTGTIDQAFSYRAVNYANVFSSAPNLGGFVGWNTGTITNAYTTSLNTSAAAAPATAIWGAGFVYKNQGTITGAFATSYWTNTAATAAGAGFVADNTGGTLTNVYWSAASADGALDVENALNATNLTTTNAAIFASYANFDPAIWAASTPLLPVMSPGL